MKLIYSSNKINEGFPVTDSCGNQIVRAMLRDGSDIILLIYDGNFDAHYICKGKSYFGMILEIKSDDFDKVEEDEAWNAYKEFFEEKGILKKWETKEAQFIKRDFTNCW